MNTQTDGMNEAQQEIIVKLKSYNNFSWGQPGDWGDDLSIYDGLFSVDDDYDNIKRVLRHVTCVVIQSHEGSDLFPNEIETFSFECRYPVHHYQHMGHRCWYKCDDSGERKEIPFETGEIADLGRAFADAFGLPVRFHREEGK